MRSVPFESSSVQTQVRVNSFVRSVYNWMAVGLLLTAAMAYWTAHSRTMLNLLFTVSDTAMRPSLLFWVLIIAELGLVFTLAARVARMQASTATALFVAYAALNGITLCSVFLFFAQATVTAAFVTCAATFLACSIFGWVTKRDLTSVGQFMFMGLVGIIIASIVNALFVRSSGMSMIISYVGVLIFVGLTAYDTQKLKNMALTQPADVEGAVVRKGAILGALSLYLDFINLFLMLLRIFGGGRD